MLSSEQNNSAQHQYPRNPSALCDVLFQNEFRTDEIQQEAHGCRSGNHDAQVDDRQRGEHGEEAQRHRSESDEEPRFGEHAAHNSPESGSAADRAEIPYAAHGFCRGHISGGVQADEHENHHPRG